MFLNEELRVKNEELRAGPASKRLNVRVGRTTLSFSAADARETAPAEAAPTIAWWPYEVKTGMSMAANLREAFRTADAAGDGFGRWLAGPWDSALVMTVTPVLLVPAETFVAGAATSLYSHAFAVGADSGRTRRDDKVMHTEIPSLGVVALFGVNRDLSVVMRDNIAEVTYMPAIVPVWDYLYHCRGRLLSSSSQRRKLYGYFHDGMVDVFAFSHNRFRFSNTFDVNNSRDTAYFLLYVWKQLGYDQRRDELHIAGDVPQMQQTLDLLRRYVQNVYVINPAADFNRSPVTRVEGMPYDLMTLYVKGR